MDKALASCLSAVSKLYNSDYITLSLKYEWRRNSNSEMARNSIINLADSLIKDGTKTDKFYKLVVLAEDSNFNDRIKPFDLLIDRVKSEVKVERKPRHKAIVPSDIFEKMRSELYKKHIL